MPISTGHRRLTDPDIAAAHMQRALGLAASQHAARQQCRGAGAGAAGGIEPTTDEIECKVTAGDLALFHVVECRGGVPSPLIGHVVSQML
jgi:hypothetical protein